MRSMVEGADGKLRPPPSTAPEAGPLHRLAGGPPPPMGEDCVQRRHRASVQDRLSRTAQLMIPTRE